MKNYIIIILTLLAFTANSQEPVKALKVGDKVPESFWQQEHTIYQNGKTTKQNLSAYKGKLLILDFWATWCGSCINKFPLLESLLQGNKAEFNVLLVNAKNTGDQLPKIEQLFTAKLPPFKNYLLATTLGDTYLDQLFPHKILPHYVWLMGGYVSAITGPEYLHPEVIKSLIQQQEKNNQVQQARKTKRS